jgi:hypothetical protein
MEDIWFDYAEINVLASSVLLSKPHYVFLSQTPVFPLANIRLCNFDKYGLSDIRLLKENKTWIIIIHI